MAREYVLGNVESLRSRYGHNYMAVLANIGIIGSDCNRFELAKRILKDIHFNPPRDVLITTIDEVINPREREMPSPLKEN
ncbi:hypothetical protein J4408_04205 [Candidatus Pacearchaeota archaeon]|nr:hypothetical protein [Candidatus Pacearchaeota archaeon]